MDKQSNKLKVAIIGSGNIGTDLLIKITRSNILECTLFVGRNMNSPGMVKARSLGVPVSDQKIDAITAAPDSCDLVFDATSAVDHHQHWPILKELGKIVIDMTPSKIGCMNIPAVDEISCNDNRNVNMVSCGGQASVPIAYLIGQSHDEVDYIEVVSSIASRSAGAATRANIDEYVETTEEALIAYSGCFTAKTILILNPALPCVNMQTTISAVVKDPDLEALKFGFDNMVKKIQSYVPGYKVIVPPTWESNRIVITVRVRGLGDYLPAFAGNLDIINCAAIATAEVYAKNRGFKVH